jgi:hypothetical protein
MKRKMPIATMSGTINFRKKLGNVGSATIAAAIIVTKKPQKAVRSAAVKSANPFHFIVDLLSDENTIINIHFLIKIVKYFY